MREMFNSRVRMTLVCTFAALGLLPGCGQRKAEVYGKVTFKGEAIDHGRITVTHDDGRTDTSEIKDGAYALYQAPVGPVKITVTSIKPVPHVNRHGGGQKPPEEAGAVISGPDTGPAKKYIEIPKKYSELSSTDLTYEVKGGKTEYNIDLPP